MLRTAMFAAILAVLVAFTGGSAAATGAPMADAGLDQTVTVETTVQLDGTGSAHPDGELSGYEWSIRTPDGRVIEPACADCDRTRFTPSTVGRYEVTLTVTGPDGAESTDTLYVYVEDAGPEVSLSGDRTPDPAESVTYTATAESPDAELEEIAWAVEDRIVAVRSLDGSTDESQLSLAFADADTYRVQVVVLDSNGRTAYDQLYVQPQVESSATISMSEPDPTGCEDSVYAANHPVECWGIDNISIERPESEPEPDETPTLDPEEILYETEGYEWNLNLGQGAVDSRFVNTQVEEFGFDNGDNAPWNRGKVLEPTVDEVSTFLFGQERRTETCEMTVGEISTNGCHQRVLELENEGGTTNAYSGTATGRYTEYGLTNAERVRGQSPPSLEEGQKVEVTVVIQQEEDGLIDHTVETLEPVSDSARDTAASIGGIGSEESSGESATGSRSTISSTATNVDHGESVSSNRGGYLSSTSTTEIPSSTTSEPSQEQSSTTPGDSNPDRGLVA